MCGSIPLPHHTSCRMWVNKVWHWNSEKDIIAISHYHCMCVSFAKRWAHSLPWTPEWAEMNSHFTLIQWVARSSSRKSARFSPAWPSSLTQLFRFQSGIQSNTDWNKNTESVRMHRCLMPCIWATWIAPVAACISDALLVARPYTGKARFLHHKKYGNSR